MKAADVRAAEAILRLFSIDEPRVVEIGCYTGDMSKRLLRLSGLRLWMVDPWSDYEGDTEYKATGDEKAFLSPEQWAAVRKKAMRSVAFARDRVTVMRDTSAAAGARLPLGASFDMVFIDGDHSYPGTAQDIKIWWPRVCVGGWLGGHDYRSDKNFGAVQAVDEFAVGKSLQLGGNYTWWVQKT